MRPLHSLDIAELNAHQADPNRTFSQIIDVRSPAEYAEDHIPGAINLFALDNDQRAQIGTLYKQVNPFEARKLGASLVCANVSNHLRAHLLDRPKDFRPLLYCWRGGQRSNSFASVLAQIGWEVSVLTGGYKAYRRSVIERLGTICGSFEYIVIGGHTGSGKTELLHEIARQGGQILDLEGYARHRGSLLGAETDVPAANQKQFDSALSAAFSNLDPTRPVFVESESAKIGRVFQPGGLWSALGCARYVQVAVDIDQRAQFILDRYADWCAAPAALKDRLSHLKQRLGRERLSTWIDLIDRGRWHTFVEQILIEHYDPAYNYSQTGHFRAPELRIDHDPTNAQTVQRTAARLLEKAVAGAA